MRHVRGLCVMFGLLAQGCGACIPDSTTASASSSGSSGMPAGGGSSGLLASSNVAPGSSEAGSSRASSSRASSSGRSSSAAPPVCTADGDTCTRAGGQPGLCCAGTCVSPEADATCGSCTRSCTGDTHCTGGECARATCDGSSRFCLPGGAGSPAHLCCGDACVDPRTDNQHCNTCDQDCTAQGEVCVASACVGNECSGTGTECTRAGGGTGLCCAGLCVDSTDEANCRGCGLECPADGICGTQQGSCRTSTGLYSQCRASGQCGPQEVCVFTLQQDRCVASECTPEQEGYVCGLAPHPGTQGLMDPGLCCGSACVDRKNDAQNCGTCGNACGPSQYCENARCVARPTCTDSNAGTACPFADGVPGICCGTACVDPNSPQACGACGNVCPAGTQCEGGNRCVDGEGNTVACDPGACTGDHACFGSFCRPLVCTAGGNGQRCAYGAGLFYVDGVCCGGDCVDVQRDPDHCAGCGQECASGYCTGWQNPECLPPTDPGDNCGGSCGSAATCVGGRCVAPCTGSEGSFCPAAGGVLGACCGLFGTTACVDLATDQSNCGSCGVACPDGVACVDGNCGNATASGCGNGHNGQYCAWEEGLNFVCCSEGCTDVKTSNQNCGSCGRACAAGLSCVDGACLATSCTPQREGLACQASGGGTGTCCSSTCVDTQTDENNCGQCGRGCAGGLTCELGACGLDVCDPSHVGAPCHRENGAGVCCAAGCVDTQNDAQNCSGCGLSCGAGRICVAGGCQTG